MNPETNSIQANKNSIHPTLIRLLENRGYGGEAAKDFFSWSLTEIPPLTSLLDIDKSALRILDALDKNQPIGIYGDYDVDGTTSCALFYRFFQMLGVKVKTYQPSRFIEGYGLHLSSIDTAVEDGIKLLITVDCGITNNEAADYSKHKGIDLIITDHHKDAAPEMPKAYAVVNPNRRDETCHEDLKSLAGVGVAFAICIRVRELLIKEGAKIASLYPLLSYVAIGTIADLAKLNTINLRLVRHGLRSISTTPYPGIKNFFSNDERSAPLIPSEKISFFIGPLINSKGRLDHPEKALELLISDDEDYCLECFRHLEMANQSRKFIQNQVFKEAKDNILKTLSNHELPVSICYSKEWHEGVIGIVASKLVDTFKVPAIVFCDAEEEGIIKASARTAGTLNMFNALNDHKDLFLKFGGHKAAAGLSMKKENFHVFKNKMTDYLQKIPPIERIQESNFDLELSFDDVNAALVKGLEQFEPFGMGNPKPVFRIKDAKIESFEVFKDAHVRWNIGSLKESSRVLKGISFYYVGKWNHLSPEEIFEQQKNTPLNIQCTLGVNRFRGVESIQLIVEKID